jgi:hypothetical protein
MEKDGQNNGILTLENDRKIKIKTIFLWLAIARAGDVAGGRLL